MLLLYGMLILATFVTSYRKRYLDTLKQILLIYLINKDGKLDILSLFMVYMTYGFYLCRTIEQLRFMMQLLLEIRMLSQTFFLLQPMKISTTKWRFVIWFFFSSRTLCIVFVKSVFTICLGIGERSALLASSRNGHADVVKMFIESKMVDVNQRDSKVYICVLFI